MSQKIKLLSLFLLVSLLTITCKQKAKEGDCVHEEAHIYLTVIDNKGLKVDNAVINVFDSFDNYEKARVDKNNSTYALATFSSSLSQETEVPVDPYVEHWILVTKYDSAQLKFLSSELKISKIDKLQSCSDYHVTIDLVPVGATVAFWTASNLNLNIKIKFNGLLDSLTGSTSTAPLNPASPGFPSQLNFPVKAGTYQYQATAAGNCTWQGEVTVTDGEFKTIQLESCARTVVAFYTDASSSISSTAPNNKYPIQLFIDNNPTPVGTINGIASGTVTNSCPTTPATVNVLYVYLEPGVAHTYKAVSASGNTTSCIWTGTTNVLGTNCASNPAIKLGSGCN